MVLVVSHVLKAIILCFWYQFDQKINAKLNQCHYFKSHYTILLTTFQVLTLYIGMNHDIYWHLVHGIILFFKNLFSVYIFKYFIV